MRTYNEQLCNSNSVRLQIFDETFSKCLKATQYILEADDFPKIIYKANSQKTEKNEEKDSGYFSGEEYYQPDQDNLNPRREYLNHNPDPYDNNFSEDIPMDPRRRISPNPYSMQKLLPDNVQKELESRINSNQTYYTQPEFIEDSMYRRRMAPQREYDYEDPYEEYYQRRRYGNRNYEYNYERNGYCQSNYSAPMFSNNPPSYYRPSVGEVQPNFRRRDF